MSRHNLYHHIVFSTSGRYQTIPVTHDRDLYGYIRGIIVNMKGFVYWINGMPDHIHIVATIPPTISISNAVKTIKQASSIWLKGNPNFPHWHKWEEGSCVKTFSRSDLENVVNYVKNQKSHHANLGFQEEWDRMCNDI